MNEEVRVYVGVDRSQLLAVKVLEYSIKKYSTLPVKVIPMLDLPYPIPKDPRNDKRTGFSFSRFCIPKLANYSGRAIYMDADMQVFTDIRELWETPFDGAKIVIQEDLSEEQSNTTGKIGAPKKRIKQCAVMLLDCSRLDWKIENIIKDMDNKVYDYPNLMYNMCILNESEIKYGIPFRWNSLEHWDKTTSLIHYTDMATQPWASPENKHGEVWFKDVREMMQKGLLTKQELQTEIDLGYFRPSLPMDLAFGDKIPQFMRRGWELFCRAYDKKKGFTMHKEVYAAKRKRDALIKEYEKNLKTAEVTL